MKYLKVRFRIIIKLFNFMRIRFTTAVRAFAFAVAIGAPGTIANDQIDESYTEVNENVGKNIVASCAINDIGEKKEHEFDFEFEGFPLHGGHWLKATGK